MNAEQLDHELRRIAADLVALARRVRQGAYTEEEPAGETAAETFRNVPVEDYGPRPGGDPEAGQPIGGTT